MRTLVDNIFDLAQNSIVAGAKNINIIIEEDTEKNEMKNIIIDDGHGIKPDQMDRVRDAFFTTRDRRKRKVGLGLSLMDATCEQSGGNLEIESKHRYGTTVTAIMELDHIDRPPLGDLADIYTSLFLSTDENKVRWKLEHIKDGNSYKLTNRKILDDLNLLSFSEPGLQKVVYKYIAGKESSF